MNISKATPFSYSAVQVQKGSVAGGWHTDDSAVVLDEVVVGLDINGAGNSQCSKLVIKGRITPDGPSEISFEDQDKHKTMNASISRNEVGLGLLTILNDSPEGFSSQVSYPLGPVDESLTGPLRESWGSNIERLDVRTGLGQDSMILLNGFDKIYLDGSVELIDLP